MRETPIVLETNISQVKWCDPKQNYRFVPAKLPEMRKGEVYWLDQILGGGVVLPPNVEGKRALTLLLAGPPGTGKSTLALEMCHRWVKAPPKSSKSLPFRILYLTSEAHEPWMRSNATTLGWENIEKQIVTDTDKWKPGTILVLNAGDAEGLQQHLCNFVSAGNPETTPEPGFWEGLATIFDADIGQCASKLRNNSQPEVIPDVVVIDSLNTLPKQKQRERLFKNFMKIVGSGPLMLVAVFNSSESGAGAEFWEFATDVVIRLDRKYTKSDYLVRTIEIVKARYQEHAFGKHQLKTYRQDSELQHSSPGKSTEQNGDDVERRFNETYNGLLNGLPVESPEKRNSRLEEYAARTSKLMRAHPYRSTGDGGLAIFPSIHYVLSRYKRATPTVAGKPIASAIPDLTKLLHGGYPSGRCTAFIGGRGGHKSHLAYVELLHRVKSGSGKAAIVSLRDDEGVTRQTMEKILVNRWNSPNPREELLRWEAQGLLDVTYYPPGYITPEEFFHRLMLSINRLKADSPKGTTVTLLFNSLDQLSSRFPLCVEETVFVPGIIQMLSGETISSFFVSAKEESRAGYYGLETMAELIIDFERKEIEREEMLRYIGHSSTIQLDKVQREELTARYAGSHQAVVVEVARHAGGQAAGAQAVLELVEKGDPLHAVSVEHDLVVLPFMPLSDL